MHVELSTLMVWIALWIVNTYSEFQGNIFSSKQDITNVKIFAAADNDNDDTKAIAIPQVFSENSQAKNSHSNFVSLHSSV